MFQQFYNDILPDIPGQRIVATIDGKKVQHYVVGSVEEIIPFLKGFPEYNTYHSLGAYQGLKEGKLHAVSNDILHKSGPLKGQVKIARIPDASCQLVKSFGFDLDVGDTPDKYDTLEEAYQDLARVIEEGHIPEPRWVMYSGGGLQFYLVLEGSDSDQASGGDSKFEGLPEAVWTSRFQQLRAHLTEHLKIDRTVGSHPYRLLRSPCTPNWKYEEPVNPTILNDTPGPFITLDWLDTLTPIETVAKVKRSDDVSLSCDQPVGLKKVLKACAAMREQYTTKGRNTSYPVWLATGNICAHTFEFRKGFHRLSEDHPDYNEVTTDDKFQEIVNNAASGPFGCDHFGSTTDPDSPCHGCWAKPAGLTNPISATRHLGKKPVPTKEIRQASLDEIAEICEEELNEANNWGIPEHHMPEDVTSDGQYFHNDNGMVCEHFFVRPMQFNKDREVGNVLVSKDRVDWFSIASRKLSMPAQLVGELLNYGIMVSQDKPTMQYVRNAGMLDEQRIESTQFGWGEDFTSAFLPTGSVGKLTTEPSQDLIKLQRKWGQTAGTLEGWLEAVQIYGRPGQEPYLMTLLASLSSPLLKYHSLTEGMILSLTGQGGTGKTTALRAASSVWGAPLSTISSMSSTMVATRIYLGLCGNLPMVLDEVTQMQPEDLKQFALEISQGIGRERGTKEANLAHSEKWQLVCLTTSNVSVHAKLADLVDAGSADMNRVIELPVVQSEHVSLEQGNELLQGIKENHGHIGPAFMEYVLTKDRTAETRVFRKMLSALRSKDGLMGSDRFGDSLIASCYWAHRRIKEVVPDFPGDPDQQFLWMRQQLKSNNKYIKDILTVRIPDVDDFVMEFLAENLVISKLPSGDTGYPSSGQSLKGYLYDGGEWFIVPKNTLDSWCKRHQLKPRTVLERWGLSARLKNMGPEDGQFRWSGKLQEGMRMEGKLKYPTVTLIHKGNNDDADQRGSKTGSGPTAQGAISFEDHRRKVRGGEDPLQVARLTKRYHLLQAWYAQEICRMRNNMIGTVMEPLNTDDKAFNLAEIKSFSQRVAKDTLKLKWGWDIPLLMLKLQANWDYAKDNGNKYLLRESLHGFPIMNYVLKEGPFKVSKEAVFGPEDYHLVLKGDDNLIYFQPDLTGLKEGTYVECLV